MLVTLSGGDAFEYRAAWPKALVLLVAITVPGTVGAFVVELVWRWRLHKHGA
jgi:hypothetical protein